MSVASTSRSIVCDPCWHFLPSKYTCKYSKIDVIYQTKKTLFDHWHFQTSRRELKIRRAAELIFDEIRGVWITDKTLFRVFDISCQSKQKLRSKRGSKIIKIYANFMTDPRVSKNLPHGCDFLCFFVLSWRADYVVMSWYRDVLMWLCCYVVISTRDVVSQYVVTLSRNYIMLLVV